MNAPLSLPQDEDIDTLMLKLARGIAMDMYTPEQLCQQLGISSYDFHRYKVHPRFLTYLREETEAWHSATNTHERAKLKAAAIMEEWLLEANLQLRNKTAPLNHKVELAKVVAKIAGMGEGAKIIGDEGSKFNLTINIGQGAEHRVSISTNPVTSQGNTKTIDHDAFGGYDDDYDPMISPNTLED